MSTLPQRIVCAAVRYPGYPVILGVRHFDEITTEQIKAMKIPTHLYGTEIQGFVDNFGQFLSREEAYPIAVAQQQIYRQSTYPTNELFTEMLY